METVTWPVQQQFYFPEEVGVAQRVKEFSVVPIWEKVKKKESFRLTGIYRITATILFEKGQCANEGILIDDLDVNDGEHYFEYGTPLEIDLPLREYESILLQIKDDSANIQSNGTLIISFTVECNLLVNEPQVQQEPQKPQVPQMPQVPHKPKVEQPQLESNESQEIISEESSKEESSMKEYPMEENLMEKYPKEESTMQNYPREEPSMEEEKAEMDLQEMEQIDQHEFAFLHQLKDEYSLFSLSSNEVGP